MSVYIYTCVYLHTHTRAHANPEFCFMAITQTPAWVKWKSPQGSNRCPRCDNWANPPPTLPKPGPPFSSIFFSAWSFFLSWERRQAPKWGESQGRPQLACLAFSGDQTVPTLLSSLSQVRVPPQSATKYDFGQWWWSLGVLSQIACALADSGIFNAYL